MNDDNRFVIISIIIHTHIYTLDNSNSKNSKTRTIIIIVNNINMMYYSNGIDFRFHIFILWMFKLFTITSLNKEYTEKRFIESYCAIILIYCISNSKISDHDCVALILTKPFFINE